MYPSWELSSENSIEFIKRNKRLINKKANNIYNTIRIQIYLVVIKPSLKLLNMMNKFDPCFY